MRELRYWRIVVTPTSSYKRNKMQACDWYDYFVLSEHLLRKGGYRVYGTLLKFNRRRESHEVIKGAQVCILTISSTILLSHGLDPHRTLSRVSCIAVGILTASVLYVQDPSQARLFLLCDRSQSAWNSMNVLCGNVYRKPFPYSDCVWSLS